MGGTAGDIESMHFFEAFRQMEFRVGKDNFLNIHVSLVPTPGSGTKISSSKCHLELTFLGEQKTKPIQNSVRTLRGLGLSPDLIVCRCKTPIEEPTKAKISTFCNVLPSQVISVHDVGSIYRVPIMLHDQKVTKYIREREWVQIHLFLLKKIVIFYTLDKDYSYQNMFSRKLF